MFTAGAEIGSYSWDVERSLFDQQLLSEQLAFDSYGPPVRDVNVG
jgi:hypothetical protein